MYTCGAGRTDAAQVRLTELTAGANEQATCPDAPNHLHCLADTAARCALARAEYDTERVSMRRGSPPGRKSRPQTSRPAGVNDK